MWSAANVSNAMGLHTRGLCSGVWGEVIVGRLRYIPKICHKLWNGVHVE